MKTAGEYLIDLADFMQWKNDQIVMSSVPLEGWQLAKVEVALRFAHQPISFRFRAIFEEWDQEKIVKELY